MAVCSCTKIANQGKYDYSKTSPQGAYEAIKRYLLKNGFEHRKDSDYINLVWLMNGLVNL